LHWTPAEIIITAGTMVLKADRICPATVPHVRYWSIQSRYLQIVNTARYFDILCEIFNLLIIVFYFRLISLLYFNCFVSRVFRLVELVVLYLLIALFYVANAKKGPRLWL